MTQKLPTKAQIAYMTVKSMRPSPRLPLWKRAWGWAKFPVDVVKFAWMVWRMQS